MKFAAAARLSANVEKGDPVDEATQQALWGTPADRAAQATQNDKDLEESRNREGQRAIRGVDNAAADRLGVKR